MSPKQFPPKIEIFAYLKFALPVKSFSVIRMMRFEVLILFNVIVISVHLCAGYLHPSFSHSISSISSSSFVKNEFNLPPSPHTFGTSFRLFAKAEGRKRRKAKGGGSEDQSSSLSSTESLG